jgi:hypothetical protein
VRQEFLEIAGALSRQAFEHVGEVAVGIMSVELCGLDQAHHGGGALARAQRSSEQPVGCGLSLEGRPASGVAMTGAKMSTSRAIKETVRLVSSRETSI